MEILRSKKMVAFLVGVAAIVVLVAMGTDMETLKWMGGFIAGMVASLQIGQGLADAGSGGKTSAGA